MAEFRGFRSQPSLKVRWQSGDAADCKSAYAGSIPARTSNLLHGRLKRQHSCPTPFQVWPRGNAQRHSALSQAVPPHA
jgi:hypothetical protein